MGIDSKIIKWTIYEEINKTDLDNMSIFIADAIIKDIFEYIVSESTPMLSVSDIVTQDTGANYQTKLAIFWGIDADNKITINVSEKTNIHDVPTTNPRIDIIEVQRKYVSKTPLIRSVIDPTTGNVLPIIVNTQYEFDVDVQITKGTESATPVAPSTTSGWMKIAEVYVDTTGGIADADIYNVDSYGLFDNTGWTTDIRGTLLLKKVYTLQTDTNIVQYAKVITTDINAIVGIRHFMSALNKSKVTLPTGISIGDIIEIIGAGEGGGWKIETNEIFYGNKKLLHSRTHSDTLKLIYVGDGWIAEGIARHNSTIQMGYFGGGYTGSVSDVIDYIDQLLLTGNSVDRGNLTVGREFVTGVTGIRYGFFAGGDAAGDSNVIDYIDLSLQTLATQDAIDRGDLSLAREATAGVSGPRYGFWGGGYTTNTTVRNEIDYIDHALITGNAVDRGDITVARQLACGVSGFQYGFFCGGTTSTTVTSVNIIDYINILLTTGNAIDRGDLVTSRWGAGGVQGDRYGFIAGGGATTSDAIEYIDLTLISGNAVDRGDLTAARYAIAGTSGFQYGFFAGGQNPYTDVIDYIDMNLTTGNATDRGNLTVGRRRLAGV